MRKLLVLEGIDGVGKTTLSKMIVTALVARGIPSIRYEDIEDLQGGLNPLKPYIKENAFLEESFYFYLASALDKSRIISKHLENHFVVCDRYVYSTIAHHVSRGLDPSLVPDISRLPIKIPDHLFLITADDPIRLARATQRPNPTPEDLLPNTPGSAVRQKEDILRSFSPLIIDNSGTLQQAADSILSVALKE